MPFRGSPEHPGAAGDLEEEPGRNSDSLPLCRELLSISLDSMTILQSSGVLRTGREWTGAEKIKREDTQNSKNKVVQLLGSTSREWRCGEVLRRDQIHVPAAPAPLARALAQIPPPVARPSPQRCCCGNSIATSICQTATRRAGRPHSGGAGAPGRAGGGERPGQPRASRLPRPPPPRHRFTERDIKGENGVSGARGVLE